MGKINQLGIGILLLSNELGHLWSLEEIMTDLIPSDP
jgi:hypothetical protein